MSTNNSNNDNNDNNNDNNNIMYYTIISYNIINNYNLI